MFNYLFGQPQSIQQGTVLNRALYSLLNNDAPIIPLDAFDYVEKGYMSSGAVFECVDLITKKIASYPVLIYKITDEKKYKQYKNLSQSLNVADRAKSLILKAQSIEEVEHKRIRELIENPNDKQTWNEFISMATALYLLDGNSFIYGNGADNRSKKFTELYALPFTSKQMTILSGGMLEPVKGYTANWLDGDMTFNNPDQILHLKTLNPQYCLSGSQMYGVSPLRAYAMQLVRDEIGNQQANKLLKNGGALGMLTPKNKEDALSPEQREQLTNKIKSALGSNQSHDRIMGGSISMEWLQIGLPSTELQILDLLKANREDIYRGYHVPMYYASTDTATYNVATTAGKELIYNGIAPHCNHISQKLTQFICKAFENEGNFKIHIDYSVAPEMSADMKEVAEWLDKCDDLTPNEKRDVKGWGKLDDPLMDKIYMSKTKAPIELINASVDVNK